MEEIELQAGPDERTLNATRDRVEQLLANGWSIVGREPLTLQRGSAKLVVRSNGIIVSG